MSDNAGESSQTGSSGAVGLTSCVPERCRISLDMYRRGELSKAVAFLAIQEVIAPICENHTLAERARALDPYMSMLDEADPVHRRAPIVTAVSGPDQPASSHRLDRAHSRASDRGPAAHSVSRSRELSLASPSDERGGSPFKKRRPTVDEAKFPWRSSAALQRSLLEPELQEILDLLENWAADPAYVVRKILLSPGCPDFPPDQWLNVVKGQAVDLTRVLGAYYSTEIESQDVGDQLAVQPPRQSKVIKTHGDWIVAFSRTSEATSFALPGRRREYAAYQNFISGLFSSVQPTFHQRIIELDKAVRHRAANQKHLRLDNFTIFNDTRIWYCEENL